MHGQAGHGDKLDTKDMFAWNKKVKLLVAVELIPHIPDGGVILVDCLRQVLLSTEEQDCVFCCTGLHQLKFGDGHKVLGDLWRQSIR